MFVGALEIGHRRHPCAERHMIIRAGMGFARQTKGHQRDRKRESREAGDRRPGRSEEHTSELQSLMRTSYAVFCLKKPTNNGRSQDYTTHTQATRVTRITRETKCTQQMT